jgi:HPt (histidine-containing phosphotransfer) domain-containing protein
MAEPNFDAMDLDEDMPVDEPAGLDEELLMHAEGAGLDSTQAEALKAFVERCVSLREESAYEVEEEPAEDDMLLE